MRPSEPAIPATLIPAEIAEATDAVTSALAAQVAAQRAADEAQRRYATLDGEVTADIENWTVERQSTEREARQFALNKARAGLKRAEENYKSAQSRLRDVTAEYVASTEARVAATAAYVEGADRVYTLISALSAALSDLNTTNRFWQRTAHAGAPETYPFDKGQSLTDNRRLEALSNALREMGSNGGQLPRVPFFTFDAGWEAERALA